jgi:hypothetical protein
LVTRQNYPFCAVTSIKALGPESRQLGGKVRDGRSQPM